MASLTIERRDVIATLTLNRPHTKNAIDRDLWNRLESTINELRYSDDRVVVLTGADGDFCSGADVNELGTNDRHPLASMRQVGNIVLAFQRLPQPTIAKVSGVAAGVGMNLALMCDLVVADDTARFSEIFARRGLTVDGGGSWILPRLIGMQKAKELILLADLLPADRAAELGLVNRVVDRGELDDAVNEWAERLAAGPPIALAMSKRLVNNAFNVTLEEALDDEGAAQTVNFSTADTREAVAAFIEKRDPVFTGR